MKEAKSEFACESNNEHEHPYQEVKFAITIFELMLRSEGVSRSSFLSTALYHKPRVTRIQELNFVNFLRLLRWRFNEKAENSISGGEREANSISGAMLNEFKRKY